MGCDIHLKTFVFSTLENRMLPLTSIISDGEAKYMDNIVGERDYNLFGLFGNSARSCYPELDCMVDGFPAFIGLTLMRNIDILDYHTRKWCMMRKLKTSLDEYAATLRDPKRWLSVHPEGMFTDLAMDAIEGHISVNDFVAFHNDILSSITDLQKSISNLEQYIDEYSDMVDPGRTAFVTWMDS